MKLQRVVIIEKYNFNSVLEYIKEQKNEIVRNQSYEAAAIWRDTEKMLWIDKEQGTFDAHMWYHMIEICVLPKVQEALEKAKMNKQTKGDYEVKFEALVKRFLKEEKDEV